ncbi:MAG: T9SS type A sorting domain-containing protein [Flavobacterium sp.]
MRTISSSYYYNGFCLKLTSAGGFVWVKKIPGNNTFVNDSVLDSQGNVFVCGRRQDANLANYNGYIVKISSSGADLWVYDLVGSMEDSIDLIEVDGNDNLVAAGTATPGIDFNPAAQVDTLSPNAYEYIVKFDPAGNFIWLRGIQASNCEDLKIDSNNNIYLLGRFSGQFYYVPDTQTLTPYFNSFDSHYLIRLTSQGDYNWGFYQKNNTSANTKGILDLAGTNLYVASTFSGTADFNPAEGHDYVTVPSNSSSIYLSKFSTVNLSLSQFEKTAMKIINNPAGETLNLSFDTDGPKQLGIYAVDGKRISQQSIQGNYAALDIAVLASGIYLITCQSEFGTVTEKFVKK